jgi:uncharacterized membrane protein
VEATLTAGLTVSAALLAAGLLMGRAPFLYWGALLLMLTPVARVVVVTVGLLVRRDLAFAAVSLWILGVLVVSMVLAFRPA